MAGTKHDQGKVMMGCVDPEFVIKLAEVLTFGAQKYGRYNWRGGLDEDRIVDALLRHLYAFLKCEDTDPESGLDHRAHVAANLMFWMYLYPVQEFNTDD